MPTTAIYVRISSDPTGLRAGVERQRADCLALCERLGWAAELYEDNDASAYSGKPRPAYRRLLDDLRAGTVGALVTWHPDRLHRSPRELEDFIDLVEAARVPVHTVTAGDVDLSSPEGRLTARIVGAVARQESEHKSRRLKRKHEELATNGKPKGGGRRALGFEPDGKTVREEEAERLRQAARSLLAGESLTAVARATGWEPTSLRKALQRPRIVGLREHLGEIVGPASWPAILDESTWRAVCRLLQDPDRRGVGGRTRHGSRLCSGLARCGKCNGKMWLASARGVMAYRCRECSGVRIRADWLDSLIENSVLAALDGSGMKRALQRQNQDAELAAAQELEAVQSTLIDIASDWGRGELSRAEYLVAKREAEGRRITAQRKLDGVSSTPVLSEISGSTHAHWAKAELPRRRAIVAALVEAVVVHPALNRGSTTFDRDRISITWRA